MQAARSRLERDCFQPTMTPLADAIVSFAFRSTYNVFSDSGIFPSFVLILFQFSIEISQTSNIMFLLNAKRAAIAYLVVAGSQMVKAAKAETSTLDVVQKIHHWSP
jgi:hypothetical protein